MKFLLKYYFRKSYLGQNLRVDKIGFLRPGICLINYSYYCLFAVIGGYQIVG